MLEFGGAVGAPLELDRQPSLLPTSWRSWCGLAGQHDAPGPRAWREDPDSPGQNADSIAGWFSEGVAQSLAERIPMCHWRSWLAGCLVLHNSRASQTSSPSCFGRGQVAAQPEEL